MDGNYINIMIESLQNKIAVLDEIIIKNDDQTKILNQDDVDWDSFDRNADEKLELIERMDKLDEGFERLFEKIKELLGTEEGKRTYARQIRTMQSQISIITEKSVSIQAVEARNKQLVEQKFSQSHKRLGQSRNTSRVAMDYYKNMQQTHVVTPAFLDSKK